MLNKVLQWVGVAGCTFALGLTAIPVGSVAARVEQADQENNKSQRILSQEQAMPEQTGLVTMRGNPLTLVGAKVNVGDKAPDFDVIDNAMQEVSLSDYRGKVLVISVVPSLDTPVCDAQTRRFNVEAGQLGKDVVILTISMDLPFAQKRWCGAAGVDKVQTLSDYRYASFGKNYGVLIEELRLLARAVFIVDREGTIRYIQLVREVTEEPDYDAVLSALKKIL